MNERIRGAPAGVLEGDQIGARARAKHALAAPQPEDIRGPIRHKRIDSFRSYAVAVIRKRDLVQQVPLSGQSRVAPEGHASAGHDGLGIEGLTEREDIGRWAPNDRCARTLDQLVTGGPETDPVDNDRAAVERAKPAQNEDFFGA